MKKHQTKLIAILVSLTLFSCRKPGTQFLGKWQRISGDGPPTVQIVPNGDQYLIIEEGVQNGPMKEGGTYKDGMVVAGAGIASYSIAYIKQSDHLAVEGAEYQRMK